MPTRLARSLPWQSQYQGIKLDSFHAEVSVAVRGPNEFALVEPPRGQPDANAVVHQELESVGKRPGKSS